MSRPVDMTVIIAEANFLEQALEDVYHTRQPIPIIMLRQIHDRLQTIRDMARLHQYEADTYQRV